MQVATFASVCAANSQIIPSAPWHLRGAALTSLIFTRRKLAVLSLVRYDDSPVGPYCELAISKMTPLGPTVTTMLVTSQASRQGGREIWGFPKEVAPLSWKEKGRRIEFQHNRNTFHARAIGPQLPLRLHAWTMQTLNGQRVRVPFQVRGTVRLALVGRRLGALLDGFAMDVLPPE